MPPPKKPKTGPTRAEAFLSETELLDLEKTSPPPSSPKPGPSNESSKPLEATPHPPPPRPRRSFVSETALDRERRHDPSAEDDQHGCSANKRTVMPHLYKMADQSGRSTTSRFERPHASPHDHQDMFIDVLLKKERDKFAEYARIRTQLKEEKQSCSDSTNKESKDQPRWISHLLDSGSRLERSVRGLLSSPDDLQERPPGPAAAPAPSLETCRDPQCTFSLHSRSNLHSKSECSTDFKQMAKQFARAPAPPHQAVFNYLRPFYSAMPNLGDPKEGTPSQSDHHLVKRFLMEDKSDLKVMVVENSARTSQPSSPTHSDDVQMPSSPEHSHSADDQHIRGLPGAQVATSIGSEDGCSLTLSSVQSQPELLTLLNSSSDTMDRTVPLTSALSNTSPSQTNVTFAAEISSATSSFTTLEPQMHRSSYTTLQAKDMSGLSEQNTPESADGSFSPQSFQRTQSQEMPSSTVEEKRKPRNQGAVHDMKMAGQTCQICDDAASGFHYGVWSCEGCKAFFKRSLQGPVDYVCPATQNCTIDRQRRKSCQACRLNKCIQMGMSRGNCRREREPKAGKMSRKKKGEDGQGTNAPLKIRIKEENDVPAVSTPPSAPEAAPAAPDPMPSNPVAIHPLVSHLMRIDPPVRHANHDPSLPDTWENLMGSLFKLADYELMDVISWAKNIPGYSNLTLKMRIHLLEAAWMEVLLVGLVWRSQTQKECLLFAPDLVFDIKRIKQANVSNTCLPILKLAGQFHRLNITREEMVLLRLLVLINSDLHDLNGEESAQIEEIKQQVHEALEHTVLRRQRQPPGRLLHLLGMLPHIRSIALLSLQHIGSIKSSAKVPLEDLLSEMMEGSFYKSTNPPAAESDT